MTKKKKPKQILNKKKQHPPSNTKRVNLWIQVFSILLLQAYKIKHLAMQFTFIHICESIAHSKETTEFKHGTMIGCRAGCRVLMHTVRKKGPMLTQ